MNRFSCYTVCALMLGVLVGGATNAVAQNPGDEHDIVVHNLNKLLQQNKDINLPICEADPATLQCVNDFQVPIYSYAMSAYMKIPTVQVLSAKKWADNMGISMLLGYTVKVNNIYPSCQTNESMMTISPDQVVNLSSTKLKCQITQGAGAYIDINYQIDYIDFNDGIIGAYYTLQSNGGYTGRKTGFVRIQFKNPIRNFFMSPHLSAQYYTPAQIAEIKALMPDDNMATKVVTVYKTVYVDGKEVYTEKDKREYVQKDLDGPLVENTDAKEFSKSGTMPIRPKSDKPSTPVYIPEKAQEYIKNLELPDSLATDNN